MNAKYDETIPNSVARLSLATINHANKERQLKKNPKPTFCELKIPCLALTAPIPPTNIRMTEPEPSQVT